jgi:hypothetical protein
MESPQKSLARDEPDLGGSTAAQDCGVPLDHQFLRLTCRSLLSRRIAAPQPTRGVRLLPLVAADPLCGRGRLIPPDGIEERVGLLLDENHAAVDGLQKRFVDHVVKKIQQAIVKSLRHFNGRRSTIGRDHRSQHGAPTLLMSPLCARTM